MEIFLTVMGIIMVIFYVGCMISSCITAGFAIMSKDSEERTRLITLAAAFYILSELAEKGLDGFTTAVA